MPLSSRQLQLIHDNPNLSGASLSRFLGVDRKTVERNREQPKWKHNGKSIPFLSFVCADSPHWQVQFKGRLMHRGPYKAAMENLERLIYCLEHNNGNLPRTLNEVVFGDLEFIK